MNLKSNTDMSKEIFSQMVSASMNAGFVKILQDKLADEENPFEMRMRRIVKGIWEVEIYTDKEHLPYFKYLLNNLV